MLHSIKSTRSNQTKSPAFVSWRPTAVTECPRLSNFETKCCPTKLLAQVANPFIRFLAYIRVTYITVHATHGPLRQSRSAFQHPLSNTSDTVFGSSFNLQARHCCHKVRAFGHYAYHLARHLFGDIPWQDYYKVRIELN